MSVLAVLLVAGLIAGFAAGVWIGLGAPGWPHRERRSSARGRRLQKRPLNPVAWGRRRHTSRRER
ncbi:MAG: hypothetical protein ACREKN_01935 [Longimicrobiaceae bacterium]